MQNITSSQIKLKLYTFNWKQGGFNQVYANNKTQAIRLGNKISKYLTVDPSSVKHIAKNQEGNYYKSIYLYTA